MEDDFKIQEPSAIKEATELSASDELLVIHNGSTYTGTLEDIIKVVTKSTLDASSEYPVNSSAVNAGLTKKVNLSDVQSVINTKETGPVNSTAVNTALGNYTKDSDTLSTLDTTSKKPINSSAVNTALTDLHCVTSTPTIYLDPDRWGTYTINYAKMQRIGDIYICFGSIIVGEDASSSNLYIRVNTSFSRNNGWRLSSKWEVLNNDDYSGMLVSQGNTSLWLIKGAYTTDAGKVKGTELAGQTVTFTFIASKFDFPSTTSES